MNQSISYNDILNKLSNNIDNNADNQQQIGNENIEDGNGRFEGNRELGDLQQEPYLNNSSQDKNEKRRYPPIKPKESIFIFNIKIYYRDF